MKDIVATWVVAIALVGAVAAHSALPDLPPRLGYGVGALAPRVEFTVPGVAGPVVPPDARPAPRLVQDRASGSDLAEVLHGIARRVLGC